MGVLNNLNQLLITKAFWSSCINFFVDFMGNYGWAIILFTIVLKLILSPFDYLQRRAMKRQQKAMAMLQPEIAKIKQKYANDPAKVNQKTNELYQRNNLNMKGTCLPMLISMIVTLVVFISLFNALNGIAKSKDSEIFYELNKTYDSTITRLVEENSELSGKTNEEIVTLYEDEIEDAILKEYKNQKKKHGFLWIQNLWKADATTSPWVRYGTYKSYYEGQKGEIVDEVAFEYDFKTIHSIVEDNNPNNNGYFILILLCAVVTFGVQWFSQRSMKKSTNTQNAQTNKVMMIVMPIIMLIFAGTSNALFCLYIIVNSVMSALISKVIDMFTKDKGEFDVSTHISNKKRNDVVEYSRNYSKGN